MVLVRTIFCISKKIEYHIKIPEISQTGIFTGGILFCEIYSSVSALGLHWLQHSRDIHSYSLQANGYSSWRINLELQALCEYVNNLLGKTSFSNQNFTMNSSRIDQNFFTISEGTVDPSLCGKS